MKTENRRKETTKINNYWAREQHKRGGKEEMEEKKVE